MKFSGKNKLKLILIAMPLFIAAGCTDDGNADFDASRVNPDAQTTGDATLGLAEDSSKYYRYTFDASKSTIQGAHSYVWNFGDGKEPVVKTSSEPFEYNLPRDGKPSEVTLKIVKDKRLHQKEKAILVEAQHPTASIKVTNPEGKQYIFSADGSTDPDGEIVSYKWIIDNHSISTGKEKSLSYDFTDEGVHDVDLIVEDDIGLTDEVDTKVQAGSGIIDDKKPIAKIAANCSGLVCDFQSTGSSGEGSTIKSYNWNFGNGQTSTKANDHVVYKKIGIYNTSLTISTVADTTSDPAIYQYTATDEKPVAMIDGNCIGLSCNFRSQSHAAKDEQITEYWWDLDDGNGLHKATDSITVAYKSDDLGKTKNIKHYVVETSGEKSEIATKEMTVGNKLKPAIAKIDKYNCTGLYCTFTALNLSEQQLHSFHWDFDKDNSNLGVTGSTAEGVTVDHHYETIGDKTITLTVASDQYTNTYKTSINVTDDAPSVTILKPEQSKDDVMKYKFTSLAQPARGETITAYDWTIDGQKYTTENPTVTFTTEGTKNISLQVTETSGMTSNIAKDTLTVAKDHPVTAKITSQKCEGLACEFKAQENTTEQGADKYIWTFGDGQKDDTHNLNPHHTYNKIGSYTVGLEVFRAKDKTNATDNATVIVHDEKPAALIEVDDCAGYKCHFKSNSSAAAGETITNYFWDFDDGHGMHESTKEVTVDYNSQLLGDKLGDGTYNIQHYVVETSGEKSELATKTVHVKEAIDPAKAVILEVGKGCSGMICDLEAKDVSSQKLDSFEWNFGDGSTSTEKSVHHQYAKVGEHTITLVVGNNAGKSEPATKSYMSTDVAPEAQILEKKHEGMDYYFESVSHAAKGEQITEYWWDFDDGQGMHKSIANPIAVYKTEGSKKVSHYVVETSGEKSETATKEIYVTAAMALPKVNMQAKHEGYHVTLTGSNDSTATADQKSGDTYTWDLGDGKTSTDKNLEHDYTAAGSYKLTLKITNAEGKSSTATKTVDLTADKPVVTSIYPPQCDVLTKTCTFKADVKAGSYDKVAKYNWSLGDGKTSTETSPTITYATAGNKTISLQVESAAGVKSDVFNLDGGVNIREHLPPVADIEQKCSTIDDTMICDFSDTSRTFDGAKIAKLKWTIDGNDAGNDYSVHKEWADGLQHTVSLEATDNYSKSDTKIIKTPGIVPTPVTARIKHECNGQICTLYADNSTGDIVRYQWSGKNDNGEPVTTNSDREIKVHVSAALDESEQYKFGLTVYGKDGKSSSQTSDYINCSKYSRSCS